MSKPEREESRRSGTEEIDRSGEDDLVIVTPRSSTSKMRYHTDPNCQQLEGVETTTKKLSLLFDEYEECNLCKNGGQREQSDWRSGCPVCGRGGPGDDEEIKNLRTHLPCDGVSEL